MKLDKLKQRARQLKRETFAVYFASRDPRTPWYARMLAVCIVAYAFSPIDLIPDPIPVLGYLDDLVIVPAGIALVLRLIPAEVMTDSRARAALAAPRPANWIAAVFIVSIWLLLLALAAATVLHVIG